MGFFFKRIKNGTSVLEGMCIKNVTDSPICSSESCTNLHFPLVTFQAIEQLKNIDCISDPSMNEFKIKVVRSHCLEKPQTMVLY